MQLGLASTDIKSECVCTCRAISRLNIIRYISSDMFALKL